MKKYISLQIRSNDVVKAISAYFKVSREDVLMSGVECRNIGIYLMKKLTGMSNRQIGHLFGDLSYSSVAKVYQRFSAKLRKDKMLRERVEEIMANLS